MAWNAHAHIYTINSLFKYSTNRSIYFKPLQQLNLKIESSKTERTGFVALPRWIIQSPLLMTC